MRAFLSWTLLPALWSCQPREEHLQPDAALARAAEARAASSVTTPAPPAPRVTNVVLLTVDSLRADQPWTGYAYGHTPYLSAFAERSIVYTRAYSVANYTAASLMALLWGRYPTEMARDRCAFTYFAAPPDGLPGMLSQAGMETFAAHGHPLFAGVSAPAQGFHQWRLVPHIAIRHAVEGASTGQDVAALLDNFLSTHTPQQPFFAWAHFVEPHDRYVPHDGFPPSGHPVRGTYDAEVAYVDFLLGTVLDTLAASPHAGHTAVILTSDHGESFHEHGFWRHGYSLYEEEIRVPLMLFVPGVAPRTVTAARSTIDLPTTIAQLVGLTPPPAWRGTSLVDDWHGATAPAVRPVVVDIPELDREVAARAVILGPMKSLLYGKSGQRVFNLDTDPHEQAALPADEAQPWQREAERVTQLIDHAPSSRCELTKRH